MPQAFHLEGLKRKLVIPINNVTFGEETSILVVIKANYTNTSAAKHRCSRSDIVDQSDCRQIRFIDLYS